MMNCLYEPTGVAREDGRREFRCTREKCGHVRWARETPRRNCKAAPKIEKLPGRKPAPVEGPGTELKAIFESGSVPQGVNCGCPEKMRQMNRWGVDGCKEHRDTIIGWLRESSEKYTARQKIKAALNWTMSGLAFKLNPLDPFGSLVDEAIYRAEKKGQ